MSSLWPGHSMAEPPLEAGLEVWFNDRVRAVGGMTWKLAPTRSGIPDRLVIFPGNRMYLVELKREKGQLSPIQCVMHDRLRDGFGVGVTVLYGRVDVVDWLRDVVDAAHPQSNRAWYHTDDVG